MVVAVVVTVVVMVEMVNVRRLGVLAARPTSLSSLSPRFSVTQILTTAIATFTAMKSTLIIGILIEIDNTNAINTISIHTFIVIIVILSVPAP